MCRRGVPQPPSPPSDTEFMTVSVELADLEGLFGSEPVSDEFSNELKYWPYARATFRHSVSGLTLEFGVAPGYEQVHVAVLADEEPVLELSLDGVSSVEVERLHDRDALRVHLQRATQVLHVRLRPTILVLWPATTGDAA